MADAYSPWTNSTTNTNETSSPLDIVSDVSKENLSNKYLSLLDAIPKTSDEQVAKYLSTIMQNSSGQQLLMQNADILQAFEAERPGILEKANIDAKAAEDSRASEEQFSLVATSLANLGFFKGGN